MRLDANDVSMITAALDALAEECFHNSAVHGFWDAERNKGEMIALMHSELSEMLEGIRKPHPDEHCPEFTSEEVEAADLLIRLMDYAAGHHLRLAGAVFAKMQYNTSRPLKHGKAF